MLWALAQVALAGLGPDDVLVVYNADDPEAVETAAHYGAAREIPEAQRCGLTGIDPTRRALPYAEAATLVVEPVWDCLEALPHPDDIDTLVLVRGLPYRVDLPDNGYRVSLSALLQVGEAIDKRTDRPIAGSPQARQGNLAVASVENPVYVRGGVYFDDMPASFGPSIFYITSPRLVRGEAVPAPFERVTERDDVFVDWTDDLFIVTRLDGFDHADARALVDRGVAADGTFPDAPFLCMRGSEGARGVRDAECEHALRMLSAAGFQTEWVSGFDGELADREIIAYFTGTANLRGGIDGLTYAPGAVADNITSFGAAPGNFFCDEAGTTCPGSESQTSIARFVRAGATGVHGTVAEPLNNVFPNAGFMLLYAHGYSLGEAWLANQRYLYWVNTYLGDPLTAPFAERPVLTTAETVPLNRPIAIQASHPDGVERVVAYLDDQRLEADAELSLPTPEDLGLAEGETITLRLVGTAAPPPAVEGVWSATVPFTPGTKGWATVSLTVGPAQVDPDPDDEDGDDDDGERSGGCHSLGGTTPLALLLPLSLVLLRRRRRA
jgi:uncharacterized protein (TIGR03790 family)